MMKDMDLLRMTTLHGEVDNITHKHECKDEI